MGVPKFYRWCKERFRGVVGPPIDDTNPANGSPPECDCLYIDMNGLIHRASHNGGLTTIPRFHDIIINLFRELDYLVELIKPQRLLVIAVDGCAPRAKLNQQRTRRFRSAKEKKESIGKLEAIGDYSVTMESLFDSNAITPGTEFMETISKHLQWFIRLRVKAHPLWRLLRVIYSGVEVPGEGEHKVMNYIREARTKPDWEPNLRHCFNGADADLIMLSLATHEPFFFIIREVPRNFPSSGRKVCTPASVTCSEYTTANYQIFRSHILREYIIDEICENMSPEEIQVIDSERIIDDFVFLTFFIGSDFLPHHLDLFDGAYDILLDAYKTLMLSDPGYIVHKGDICGLNRLQDIFTMVGVQEEYLIKPKISSQLLRPDEDIRVAYYRIHFDIDVETDEGLHALHQICKSYLEGLMWCCSYYTRGCIAWDWFYPYYYSPLLKDMTDLDSLKEEIKFELGTPLTPFQQLLACLPPESSSLLPSTYPSLMTDPSSPLLTFYPPTEQLVVDMTGKTKPWEGIVKLPFLPISELLKAEALYCHTSHLSEREKERNTHGHTLEVVFDEAASETVVSCNPELGFTDIHVCCTKVSIQPLSLEPADAFVSRLIEGTLESIRGYPPLCDLPASEIEGGGGHRRGGGWGGRGKGRGRGRGRGGGRGRGRGRTVEEETR